MKSGRNAGIIHQILFSIKQTTRLPFGFERCSSDYAFDSLGEILMEYPFAADMEPTELVYFQYYDSLGSIVRLGNRACIDTRYMLLQ